LVSGSDLSLDATLLSLSTLGVPWAIARVAWSWISAIAAGWAIDLPPEASHDDHQDPHDAQETAATRSRLWRSIGDMFSETIDPNAPWIMLSLVLAAISMHGSLAWLRRIPAPLEVPLFAAAGMLVPSTSSGMIPLFAALVRGGLSSGAALGGLLVMPAASVLVLGRLSKLYGRRIAIAYAATILALAIAAGDLANAFLPPSEPLIWFGAGGRTLLGEVSAVLLGGLYLVSLFRQGPRAFAGRLLSPLFGGAPEEGHHHDH
jgi:uncharacterized membrane protein YraQ (UPF0718 family)